MVEYIITPDNYNNLLNNYRIKTEDEFKAEFGKDWKYAIASVGERWDWEEFSWVDSMNHLFGKPLKEIILSIAENRFNRFYYLLTKDDWRITNAMITPNNANNDVKEFNKSIDKNTQKCFFKIIK